MMKLIRSLLVPLSAALLVCFATSAVAADGKKKIVFLAGTGSHGFGAHAHFAGCQILAKALNEAMPDKLCAVVSRGWPADAAVLDGADAILIEHKSSGQQANQELGLPDPNTGASALPIVRFGKCKHKREDCDCLDAMWAKWIRLDKLQRASMVAPLFQAGLVSYDPNMEGAAKLVEEFASFPRGQLKDQVDAGVHGLRYLVLASVWSGPEEDVEASETDITAGLERGIISWLRRNRRRRPHPRRKFRP